MIWRGVEAYAADRDSAAVDIAAALSRGELALFLGAGISMDAKLPSWQQLVVRCCDRASIDHSDLVPNSSSETLRLRMDRVEASYGSFARYRQCVHDALYENYTILNEPTALLRAIGALMMGSHRGCVRDALTLNFDNVLETYLGLHGFVADVITDPQRLRHSVDVSVYHPNGYLPRDRPPEWTDRITFSQESFNETLGEETSWKGQIRQLLTTKVVLAVGLSFRDPILTSLVTIAKKVVAPEGRPVAFWLTTEDAHPDEIASMKKNIVVPLKFGTHDEFPDFLLRICQHAADHLRERFLA